MPQAVGWVLCLGFGFGFCAITLGLVKLETVFGGTKITSEFFNTAGRDVKVGLTAAVIVSQWTWAATLLQSSNVAWAYGVSGPFWCVGRHPPPHPPALARARRVRARSRPAALPRARPTVTNASPPHASQVRERRDDSDPPLRHPRDRD